jgi:hypothetical protein
MILSVFWTLTFVAPYVDSIKKILMDFKYNEFSNLYMILSVAYIISNLGDKYLANTKNYTFDEKGKLKRTSMRKTTVWIFWIFFFVLSISLYFRCMVAKLVVQYEAVGIISNFVIVSIFVIGGESANELLILLPSPIATLLQKSQAMMDKKELPKQDNPEVKPTMV